MGELEPLLGRLRQGPAVLVTVAQVQGSTPREPGAWMAVFAEGQVGSIGGGQLEWQAAQHARERLATKAQTADTVRVPLGPSLGQCCGGVVQLRYERVDQSNISALQHRLSEPRQPVAVFGAGHVGRALVQVLAPLPFAVHWIDSRDDAFPSASPAACERVDVPADAVRDLPAGSHVLVMSHSHVEDFDIVAACLKRQQMQGDVASIGLIGSASKWASFRQRLLARGVGAEQLAQVRCPIGLPGITGKQPGVIAVAVAAQLLQQRDRAADAKKAP